MFANSSFCFQTQHKQQITAYDRVVSTKYILTFFHRLAWGGQGETIASQAVLSQEKVKDWHNFKYMLCKQNSDTSS